jgi:hypothetical protein
MTGTPKKDERRLFRTNRPHRKDLGPVLIPYGHLTWDFFKILNISDNSRSNWPIGLKLNILM